MVRAHSLNWEEERAIVDRPFFICQIRSRVWLAAVGNQSEQTSKQALERCLPHTFQGLALGSQQGGSQDPRAGRVGGQNKQASKLLRPLAFGSLSNDHG